MTINKIMPNRYFIDSINLNMAAEYVEFTWIYIVVYYYSIVVYEL